jgi:hypothetical protein
MSRPSSAAKALQSTYPSARIWCPICRTYTGRRSARAPMHCKLCADTGMLMRDPMRSFCKKCRTPKGGERAGIATSECEACDGRGMIGGAS